MCVYIGYILPADCPEEVSAEIFRRLHIRAAPRDIPPVKGVLTHDETCWIRWDKCECGSLIGESLEEPLDEPSGPSPAEQLRRRGERKGWSHTKIERAVADTFGVRNSDEPEVSEHYRNWEKAFAYIQGELCIPCFGVFWHQYTGSLKDQDYLLSVWKGRMSDGLKAIQELPENCLVRLYR